VGVAAAYWASVFVEMFPERVGLYARGAGGPRSRSMKASRPSSLLARLSFVQAASGVVGWSSRNRAFSAFGRSCNLTFGRAILLLPVVGSLAGGRLVLERHHARMGERTYAGRYKPPSIWSYSLSPAFNLND
jgi:hypothetical protein